MSATIVWIPEISDERLLELAQRIKPLKQFPRAGLRYVRTTSTMDYLRGVAYTWDPRPTEDKVENLKPIMEIKTYHSFGHPSLFKPSIAEVIAQIPEDVVGDVVAFQIVKTPESADDLNAEPQARDAGYHVATVRLFARA